MNATILINLSAKILNYIGSAYAFGEYYQLTSSGAIAAIAGMVSMIEIKSDIGFRKTIRPPTPYSYAHKIHKEFSRFT